MHKYRNALFIIVSLLDVVYGEMSERDCERYPGPLGGAQRDSEKYGARKCGASLERQESMRAGRQGDSVVPNVERARDIRVSHPQRTTRRIGNKVKDIKSFTTIRQSLFRGPSLPRFAPRSCRYSCVADVVCRRGNRNLVNGESCFQKAAI